METNPYSAPSATAHPPANMSSGVTEGVLKQLAGTKPWVRFFSVMMFIGAGFMLIMALIMLLMGGAGIFSQGALKEVGAMGGGLGVGMGIGYAVIAILYIFPGMKLWGYASRIAALMTTRSSIDLEAALNEQRSFWKFVGIMMIVIFVLYFVGAIIAGIAFGAMAAGKG